MLLCCNMQFFSHSKHAVVNKWKDHETNLLHISSWNVCLRSLKMFHLLSIKNGKQNNKYNACYHSFSKYSFCFTSLLSYLHSISSAGAAVLKALTLRAVCTHFHSYFNPCSFGDRWAYRIARPHAHVFLQLRSCCLISESVVSRLFLVASPDLTPTVQWPWRCCPVWSVLTPSPSRSPRTQSPT